MRRSPWLMMMLAALLVWWAARVVPQALGFASAAVNVTGAIDVRNSTQLFSCSPAVPSSIPRNQTGSGTLTCWNNTEADITVNAAAGTWNPNLRAPTVRYGNPNTGPNNTSLLVPKRSSATVAMHIVVPPNGFRIPYTYTFSTATVNAVNGLQYTKTHTFTVTPT